jgi:hypothetical protein
MQRRAGDSAKAGIAERAIPAFVLLRLCGASVSALFHRRSVNPPMSLLPANLPKNRPANLPKNRPAIRPRTARHRRSARRPRGARDATGWIGSGI